MHSFSYGVGNRAASFRIPTSTAAANGKGYIEDRRPASNIDPYLVSGIIYDTGVLEHSQAEDIKAAYRNWIEWKKSQNLGNF
jgi:glutamine synthetase